MRAVLPAGLVGEHALSHLRRLPAFQAHDQWSYWSHWRPPKEPSRDALLQLVRTVIETAGAHRTLNHILAGRRVLAGLHDVDAFVSAYLDPGHQCWRHAERPCPEVLRSALIEAIQRASR
jgi:hypothetical protein